MLKKKFWMALLLPAILFGALVLYSNFLDEHLNKAIIDPRSVDQLIWQLINLYVVKAVKLIASEFTKYIVVAALSPLFAFIGERVEFLLTKKKYPYSLKQLVVDIKRALKIIIRNIIIQNVIVAVLILPFLFWETGYNEYIIPSISFLIGSYFYGFSFMDYFYERRKIGMEETVLEVRKKKGVALATGLIYSSIFLIPFGIGASLAPILTIILVTVIQVKDENSQIDLENI